jgi:hypothetical protein
MVLMAVMMLRRNRVVERPLLALLLHVRDEQLYHCLSAKLDVGSQNIQTANARTTTA